MPNPKPFPRENSVSLPQTLLDRITGSTGCFFAWAGLFERQENTILIMAQVTGIRPV